MRKFLIAAHGNMAGGMKSSLDILLGNSDCVTAINAYIDETDIREHIDAFFNTIGPDDQAIMMSDIYGGSVNQVLFTYLSKPNTFLISGINLALVIELVVSAELPVTKEEIETIIKTSRESMTLVEDAGPKATEPDDFF